MSKNKYKKKIRNQEQMGMNTAKTQITPQIPLQQDEEEQSKGKEIEIKSSLFKEERMNEQNKVPEWWIEELNPTSIKDSIKSLIPIEKQEKHNMIEQLEEAKDKTILQPMNPYSNPLQPIWWKEQKLDEIIQEEESSFEPKWWKMNLEQSLGNAWQMDKLIKDTEIKQEVEERQKNNMARIARINRKTKETDIYLELNLDGSGNSQIDTGIGFLDHMLINFAHHGFFDLNILVKGDLIVDGHHSVEDTGIVLGQAIKKAVENKEGIKRYGSSLLPMDETLVMCAIDFSNRPYLNFSANFTVEKIGYLDTELIKEFFYALSYSAGINLHIKVMDGSNNHHMIEAMFKAFAKALDEATMEDARIKGALSTKGIVD